MTEEYSGAAANISDRPKRKHSPEENVRRLQARIVKAHEEGHFNKVKVLKECSPILTQPE